MVRIGNHLVRNGTYLQGRNTNADVGNGLKDSGRGQEGAGRIERVALIYIYTLTREIDIARGAQLGAL